MLKWEDVVKNKENIKIRGITQFARKYTKCGHTDVGLYWGDEVELMACTKGSHSLLLLCSESVVGSEELSDMLMTLEYARYMLETTPDAPYDMSVRSFESLEQKLENRKMQVTKLLQKRAPDAFLLQISCFPDQRNCYALLPNEDEGSGRTETPELCYGLTRSKVFPANAITHHPRFKFFTENIAKRRGKIVEGYIKVMADKNTKDTGNKEGDAVLIDAMGLGMGCCSFQVTIQYKNLDEARGQYDFLAVLAPLMLRLSRATPVVNGYLLNTETRWEIIGFSVDCRTRDERDAEYTRSGYSDYLASDAPIPKSRFSSVDLFISLDKRNLAEYNDTKVPTVPDLTDRLGALGVDALMARNVSSLFVRDPLISYESTEEDHALESYTKDFENIQSSNWRSVRLNLPAGDDPDLMGWKVEFRTLEVQPTSFENAAFAMFLVLLSRAAVRYNINLYIPMSLVEYNFVQANKLERKPEDFESALAPDTVLFYYRLNIFDDGPPRIEKGTLHEIFNGKDGYEGLVSIVRRYASEEFTSDKLDAYTDFISAKCSGKYMSVSEYIRKFLINHRLYKNDSVVGREMINDLIDTIRRIEDSNDASYLAN